MLDRSRLPQKLLASFCLAVLALAGLSNGSAQPASAESKLLRWGYVVTTDPTSRASLQSSGHQLDFVSPGYFGIDGAGQLTGTDDPAISAIARQNGSKLLPMVQNRSRYGDFSALLSQPDLRAGAVAALVGLVDRYGYDGIHIDFEGLNASDKDALSQFVFDLASQLRPRGKLTTIAVPSRVGDAQGAWSAPYDYPAIGQSADYIVIMAYAFRTPSNTAPGSISPASQVELAAKYAAAKMPSAKVLLGVGLWGYDWNTTARTLAAARRFADTQALAQHYGGSRGYDQVTHSAWLRYTDGASKHEIWYEDYRSVAAKLAIAGRSGLAGVAYWRLGQEDPAVWQPASSPAPAGAADYDIANGHYFTQAGAGTGLGYRVTDDGSDSAGQPIRFWSEFRRLGGITTLGYPVSRRYVGPGGFTYQAFQRGVLQWRPEVAQAYLANTFEQLSAAGRDAALAEVGIPTPVADDGSGGDWQKALRTRIGWLTNPEIRARFYGGSSSSRNAAPGVGLAGSWSEAAAIQLYGLPASAPVKSGPFIVQRFQRMALQLWVEDVPGMPAKGSVVGILGGDLLKNQGLVPAEAATPEPAS